MAIVWRTLLGFSLIFLGFASGAGIGGRFLVATNAGLAGAAEVLGYGVVGAIGALILGVVAGFFRLREQRLRTTAIVFTVIAVALFALLSLLDGVNPRQQHQASSAPVTAIMGRQDESDADLSETPETDGGVLYSQDCAPTTERHATTVAGSAAGGRSFAQAVGPGWTFMLRPAPYGWDVRLLDHDGLDLSQITPPYPLAPNPRELYGWHFRNAANTGPNTGDVNAPQQRRAFQFSPSLTGTGGFRPSAPFSAPDEAQGRGVLTIVDMELSDLQPGAKAKMISIEFVACLTWPKAAEEIFDTAAAAGTHFLDEEHEIMLRCGLDAKTFELSAWVSPRWLDGHVDDDDAIDVAAPIIRRTDKRKGIALCHAGTELSLFGYDAMDVLNQICLRRRVYATPTSPPRKSANVAGSGTAVTSVITAIRLAELRRFSRVRKTSVI